MGSLLARIGTFTWQADYNNPNATDKMEAWFILSWSTNCLKKLFVISFLLMGIVSCTSVQDHQPELRSRLDQMEAAVQNQQPEQVALIYSDEGYLASPNRILAQGRTAIDRYWKDLCSVSTDWKLEELALSDDLSTLQQHQEWKNLGSAAPPLPSDLLIDLSQWESPLFQLGRSTLTIQRDSLQQESIVNFLLVWAQEDGDWRIAVDLYQ